MRENPAIANPAIAKARDEVEEARRIEKELKRIARHKPRPAVYVGAGSPLDVPTRVWMKRFGSRPKKK